MKNTGFAAVKQILDAVVGKFVTGPSTASDTDANSPVIQAHASHVDINIYRNAIVVNKRRNELVAQKLLIMQQARPDISLVSQYAKGMFLSCP